MRILHLSDLHAHLGWYSWLRHEAAAFDLVCLTGDLVGRWRDPELGRQIDEVVARLTDLSAPLAVCSGNHDQLGSSAGGCDWLRQLQGPAVWVDGARFVFRKKIFCCIPWKAVLPTAAEEEIWLCHCPPMGSRTAIARRERVDFGDLNLATLCRAGNGPALALSGHVHDPWQGADRVGRTLVLNPGHDAGAAWPAHHVIDLEQGSVEHHRAGRPTRRFTLHTGN